MPVLQASAFALSLAGLCTLAVLINEIRKYGDAPVALTRLALVIGVFGLTSVGLRTYAYLT